MSELCAVWEASVRATHTFLPEEDIGFFAPFVYQALASIDILYVVWDSHENPCGFLGLAKKTDVLDTDGQQIEMLFLHPSCFGRGIGRKLVLLALENHQARYVDVNEQNPQALGFYLHLGFSVCGRSPLDQSGKPYPILHLEKLPHR